MRTSEHLLVFGIMTAILAVLMFASVTTQSNIHSPAAIENAAANSR
jgi:hypothetical protein